MSALKRLRPPQASLRGPRASQLTPPLTPPLSPLLSLTFKSLTLLGAALLGALSSTHATPLEPRALLAPLGQLSASGGSLLQLDERCRLAMPEERGMFTLERGAWRYEQGPSSWRDALLIGVELSCDLKGCEEGGDLVQSLKRAIKLPLWQPLTPERLSQGWRHLMQTGLFTDSSYLLFQESEGVAQLPNGSELKERRVSVTICARTQTIIRSLKVSYSDPLSALYPKQFISEVQKRLNLKRGGVFPSSPRFLRAQEAQVRTLYERLGYEGTKVRIKTTYHAQGKLVDVEVQIDEGERPRVKPPLVYQDPTGPQLPYAEVAQAIVPDSFFDLFPNLLSVFGVGRYDRRFTRDQASALEELLREEGYMSARVRAVGEALEKSAVRPVIKLSLGPRLEVVFKGNEQLSDEELREVLTFKESGAIDEAELEQSRLNIEQRYRSVAHYYARVRAQLTREGDLVTATFSCDEGPQVYVGELELKGVERLNADELKAQMRVQGVARRGVLFTLSASSGVLQDAALNQDLERVIRRYQAEGFSQVKLRCERAQRARGAKAEPLWSTEVNQHRCFKVTPDQQERRRRRLLHVEVTLQEGERTTVDHVDIRDYLDAMDESMRDDAHELMQGMGFYNDINRPVAEVGLSVEKMNLIEGIVLRYLRRAGHLNASVTLQCQLKDERGELTPPQPCDLKALYGQSISRLSAKVTLGPRATVDGLILRGHLKTRPEVIKREVLLRRGAPLNSEALLLSQTNLRSLGLFRSVNIESVGLDEQAPQAQATPAEQSALNSFTKSVTMVVSVEESPPWQADALFGLLIRDSSLSELLDNSDSLLYSTTLTLRHKNVGGRAWELGGGVSHDNRLNTPLDLQGDDTAWNVGPFLNNPRLFGTYTRLNSALTFEQSLSAQRDSYVQRGVGQANVSYDFYNLSFPSRWGKGLRLDVKFEGKVERKRALSVDGERRSFGESTESLTLAPRLLYDQRDNPIHPTRGFYASVGVDALLLLSNVNASFRETLTAQWVRSLWRQRLIFVPSLRFGAVQSELIDAELPADFSFKAGGDGVPFPVRGYTDASIEACQGVERATGACSVVYEEDDFDQRAPLKVGGRSLINLSLEARFPTMLMSDLWGAVFTDLGAVSTSLSELELDDVYPSVGAGLRWLVTGQIPVRLDLAYPLRPTVFDPQRELRLHINIFYTL